MGRIDIKSSFPGVDAGVMEALTLAYLSAEYRFLGVAVISAWLVLMCLKTIGHGYYMSVCWHNLKHLVGLVDDVGRLTMSGNFAEHTVALAHHRLGAYVRLGAGRDPGPCPQT